MQLEPKDQRLLALLRDNARMSVIDMARTLGVSRATVQNRMRRLESQGVITGYTVVVGTDIEDSEVRALMSIQSQSAREAAVIAELRGNPNVTAIHHTTGRWDLIAEIQTDSLAAFNQIVGAIRLIEGVTATETNLLLDSY
ncbi:MAG: Lrp/AsnC family transcriptional regulator [Lysobacterales bacterium]